MAKKSASQEYGYLYLHGFASTAQSRKGVWLKERLANHGIDLTLLDLNRPSFSELCVDAILRHVEQARAQMPAPRVRMVGSSFGGWLAARYAELHPADVSALVLLCPAFDMAGRWPKWLDAETFERWRTRGRIDVPDASGRLSPLHYRFYEALKGLPAYPEVPCPTTIVHGLRDEKVPVDQSRRYAATRAHVELIETDDVHNLLASLAAIEAAAIARFALESR